MRQKYYTVQYDDNFKYMVVQVSADATEKRVVAYNDVDTATHIACLLTGCVESEAY